MGEGLTLSPTSLWQRLRYHGGAWLPLGSARDWFPRDRRAPLPSEFARYGERSWIVPPTSIRGAGAMTVGDDVVILEHGEFVADAPLHIGDRARLGRGVSITCAHGITIGRGVSTSDFVSIADATDRPVTIEDGAYLGYGCRVGPGVTVGEGAFVGEGAVVTGDVPARTVVYGDPAIVTRHYDTTTAEWHGARFP